LTQYSKPPDTEASSPATAEAIDQHSMNETNW